MADLWRQSPFFFALRWQYRRLDRGIHFVSTETPGVSADAAVPPSPPPDSPSQAAQDAPSARDAAPLDSGLASLAIILRVLGQPVDPSQLQHRFGKSGASLSAIDLLRAAKALGVKAREINSRWDRLDRVTLPALAQHKDGHFFVLAKAAADKVLIQDPRSERPSVLTRAEFEAAWSGALILFTTRAQMSGGARRFDFTWFIPAIVKYRKLFSEVLVGSFFLQLFGLITPLFFQVIIDKVLVHRGLSTLDVLVLGLVVVTVFEALLGGLRAYTFSHTTTRMDVELGARLFDHTLVAADGLFPGAARGRHGRARARAGDGAQFPDRLGGHAGHRPRSLRSSSSRSCTGTARC